MNIIDIIEKKKSGKELTKEEIEYTIDGLLSGEVKDYQMSSLLMAICLKGMTYQETADLTLAMRDSGDVLDLSEVGKTVVDKHSTGGVGDKTTLIIAPIMASLGIPIAKMSGRGLGITGGTIDKLESIPGFSSDVSDDDFIRLVKSVGMVDAAQTKNLAPADKALYALRDVTGTVDSIPLIASSIMSKKLASGADAIVLDVKCGSGAFMRDEASATELAKTMISIAGLSGKKCSAVISDMNQPLGYTIGNLLEIIEVVRFLSGKLQDSRLYALVVKLCTEMYMLSDLYGSLSNEISGKQYGDDMLERKIEEYILNSLSKGKAYDKFKEFVASQGGDISFIEKLEDDEKVKDIIGEELSGTIDAPATGIISSLDAELFGRAALTLGAGRMTKESEIDPLAGIVLIRKVGDSVKEGEPIALIFSKTQERIDAAEKLVLEGIQIKDMSLSELGNESIVIKTYR